MRDVMSRIGKQSCHIAGYKRVSTADQASEGHSLDAQEEAIVQFASQRDWEVARIYEDSGISGTRSDRPSLEQLLADAARGQFDVVIVHSIDRFYRDLQGLLKALNYLQAHDVAFISIAENIDFTTPWGKLALAVLGTLAEIYIDKLSAETKKGKRQRARKGLYNGTPPLGYCKGNCSACSHPNGEGYCPRFGGADLSGEDPSRSLFAHPIESVAVRLAYQWYATGRVSDGKLAERLNSHEHTLDDGTTIGFRTKGAPGRFQPGRFGKDSVRELLQHPFYTGKVPYYGRNGKGSRRKRTDAVELYDGKHPALVSQELFGKVQQLRSIAGTRNRTSQGTPRLYPLSGLIACWQCRRRMRANSVHGCSYYNDTTRIEHLGPCRQPAIATGVIEAQIVELFRGVKLPSDWREHVNEVLYTPRELHEVRAEEASIQERMDRTLEV